MAFRCWNGRLGCQSPSRTFFSLEPFIQSVLFGSPYSGCRRFSGWPKDPCHKAPGTLWPAQNRLQPAFCVDRYHKSAQLRFAPAAPRYGPPRATRTVMTPPQAGRFTVKGPSLLRPFSIATAYGITWEGDETWESGGARPGTENHGLA